MIDKFAAAALVLAGLGAGPVAAQSGDSLAAARSSGIVGERFDGYMGVAGPTSGSIRAQVRAINIKRRSLYIGLASRRNVTAQVAGIAAGCELLARVAVGEVYMLPDGAWRRREPGQTVPRPEQCPAD